VSPVWAEPDREQAPEVAGVRQWRRESAACLQVPDLDDVLDEPDRGEEPTIGRQGKTVEVRAGHAGLDRGESQTTRLGVANVDCPGAAAHRDESLAVPVYSTRTDFSSVTQAWWRSSSSRFPVLSSITSRSLVEQITAT